MKRGKSPLPRNWADLLTLADAQSILDHWKEQVGYYDMHPDMCGAARHGRITRTRVDLWEAVIRRKRDGQKCHDLVDAARQRGDEPLDLDLSVPCSTPVSPIKTGAKVERNLGPSLFD